MIEGIVVIVFVPVLGLSFWICSMLRHGTCDMWKLINASLTAFSIVIGVFLYVHSFAFLRTSKEDAAWAAIAGFLLTLYSAQQIVILFREIYAQKVEPIKVETEKNRAN